MQRLSEDLSVELFAECPRIYAPSPKIVAIALLRTYGFERIFRYCQRRGIWPDPDLAEPKMAPIAEFSRLELPEIPTVNALADWLMLPVEKVEYFADRSSRHERHGETSVNHYFYALRRKKSHGTRLIEAPKPTLKSIQRRILSGILDQVPVHRDAFGFVRGRNCVRAAARHSSEQLVVRFDLKNFFPTVGTGRVFGLFRCLGYPHAVAASLSGLCTTRTPHRILERMNVIDRKFYREVHLPQGAPTSPSLANHITFALDRRLGSLARSLEANYSRYADDLTFSGDRGICATLLKVVPEIVRDEGLYLNHQKTQILSRSSRQLVTGIVVNDHINISRRKYDQIKATIHACGKPGDRRIFDPVFRSRLIGKIGWVETVNQNRGWKLRQKLASVINDRMKI